MLPLGFFVASWFLVLNERSAAESVQRHPAGLVRRKVRGEQGGTLQGTPSLSLLLGVFVVDVWQCTLRVLRWRSVFLCDCVCACV